MWQVWASMGHIISGVIKSVSIFGFKSDKGLTKIYNTKHYAEVVCNQN